MVKRVLVQRSDAKTPLTRLVSFRFYSLRHGVLSKEVYEEVDVSTLEVALPFCIPLPFMTPTLHGVIWRRTRFGRIRFIYLVCAGPAGTPSLPALYRVLAIAFASLFTVYNLRYLTALGRGVELIVEGQKSMSTRNMMNAGNMSRVGLTRKKGQIPISICQGGTFSHWRHPEIAHTLHELKVPSSSTGSHHSGGCQEKGEYPHRSKLTGNLLRRLLVR